MLRYFVTSFVGEIEDVRLVGGRNPSEGRVELFVNNTWATICDNSWDIYDASVICSILGFVGASEAYGDAFFGQGTGEILVFDYGNCTGQEKDMIRCLYNYHWSHDCDHSEDAGVRCSNNTVRLVGGRNPAEGTVELHYDNQWSTICDDSWDINDGQVICAMLGYSSASFALGSAFFGEGRGDILLHDVGCHGDEDNILNCSHQGLWIHNCLHSEDAGVVCSNKIGKITNIRFTLQLVYYYKLITSIDSLLLLFCTYFQVYLISHVANPLDFMP